MDVGREGRKMAESDRISNLPDGVLARILSLLPTKYAVATSVLSKEWKNSYLLSHTLDFDDSLFINQGNLSTPETNSRFQDFVNRILDQYKESHVSKFRLKCGYHVGYELVNSWIIFVLYSLKVAEIELIGDWSVPYMLRSSNLSCQHLEALKLENCFVDVRNFMRFPCLKVLFFKECAFSDGSFDGILRGCPLLEEYLIIDCHWNQYDLSFSHPLLKKLTIDVGFSGSLNQLNGCRINFNLPSLVCLKYNYGLPRQFDVKNLSSVVNAHIEVCFNEDKFDDGKHLSNTMLDLIKGVSNSNYLYLSGQCLEALTGTSYEHVDFILPVFRNLTQLNLGHGYDVSWKDVLPNFLNSSPSLETLTLVQAGGNAYGQLGERFLLGDHQVPSCVSACLKVLNLENFTGLEEEIDVVVYFLEKAKALEQMVIHWGRQEKMVTENEFLNFPKASKTCLISFK